MPVRHRVAGAVPSLDWEAYDLPHLWFRPLQADPRLVLRVRGALRLRHWGQWVGRLDGVPGLPAKGVKLHEGVMEMALILDLCGGTGAWSRPYIEAGYDVELITLPKQDVRLYMPPSNVHGVLAAPPCTEFSFAKHLHGKGKYHHDFLAGLSIVDACLRIVAVCEPKWWVIENPRGYLRRWLGKPRLTFDPCDYGDPYKKKTDLWGSFNLPTQNPVAPVTDKKFSLLRIAEIPNLGGKRLTRQERRAITPAGFAMAFFEANQ